jgi:hypothetical protein
MDSNKTALRFMWNGIKVGTGKLQKAFYSEGALLHHPSGTITVYARDYKRFSAEVRDAFRVENDTDSQTDYFESDRFRVTPDHPLYPAVLQGVAAWKAHYDRRDARKVA